jgi:carbamoyltransferase
MKQAKSFRSLEEIVSLSESVTHNYADLAYAIQEVTEKCILEIVEFWIHKTSIPSISLAGGVFANVKINQRLSESPLVSDVQIYPNMGDGGIALGGVWHSLQLKGKLQKDALYSNMFLAPMHTSSTEKQLHGLFSDTQLKFRRFANESEKFRTAAELIATGKLVALHEKSMEFGPRALGSRSLLLDPRDNSIQVSVNARLKRTEFMPFAPMVLEEHFHEWFDISPSQTMTPFKYMTMTCNVKKSKAHEISAVVHVDGTARPQTVNAAENNSAYGIISEFMKITGIPLMVNTSLNIHEEPINNTLLDSIRALKRDVIDCIFSEDYLIERR